MELNLSIKKQWLQPTLVHLNSKSTQADPCTEAGKVVGFSDGTLDLSSPPVACGTS